MTENLRLGRVAGVRVGMNWSLLPIFLLISWSLAETLLPSAAPGYTATGYWVFALATTTAFYASLLAHELAHAVVARRRGLAVNSIVLWLLGGVAQLEGDIRDARGELEMAAAGPAASLAIAAAGGILAWILSTLGVSSLMVAAVAWLAGINALLAAFNMLPAFPLDGGRILRAALWRKWGDRERATKVASKVGRIGGFGLIAVGALEFLLTGGALGGIWLAVIGWFVATAAGQQPALERQRSGTPDAAAGIAAAPAMTVAGAMTRDPLTVPATATIAEAIERYVKPNGFVAFPVVDDRAQLVGLATVKRMAVLPRESWASTPILSATAPRTAFLECSPEDQLATVAAQLVRTPERRAIVLQSGRIVGIMTPSDAAPARP